MRAADEQVLDAVVGSLLMDRVLDDSVARAVTLLRSESNSSARAVIEDRLGLIDRELGHLAQAIAETGPVATLLAAIRDKEAERGRLSRQRDSLLDGGAALDDLQLANQLRERLADWRGLLRCETDAGKLALRALLIGPLIFTPREDGTGRYYEFAGEGTVEPLVVGLVPQNVASPTGFGDTFEVPVTTWFARKAA